MENKLPKILFVCLANRLRSRTAYEYFSVKYAGKYEVDSCGLGKASVKQTQMDYWSSAKDFTKELYQSADYIFCMEREHVMEIMRRNKDGGWGLDLTKLYCLDIDDIYHYNDPPLIELLEKKVPEYLESLTPLEKEVPEAFKTFLKQVPLRIKLRAVLKQNDVKNWKDGVYIGDTAQLENTVQALEVMINNHFENSPE